MPKVKPEIFVSYAWGGDSEAIVNEIDESFQKRGITIVRDKRDLGFKGKIKPFMQKIGKGKYVIVVISKKYLRSKNCMFEMLEISRNENWFGRIYPVILEDANIYDATDRIDYFNYWDKKAVTLSDKIKKIDILTEINNLQEELKLFVEIRRSFDDIAEILSDMNALTPELHRNSNFKEMYEAIEAQLKLDIGVKGIKKEIGHFLYLKCNRKKQRSKFHQSFTANISKKCKVQFYAMCCEEGDIPDSMIQRFRSELMQEHLNNNLFYKRVFHTIEGNDLAGNKMELKYELANKFDMDKLDVRATDLSTVIHDRKLNAAVVSHQLTIKNWDEVTKQTIKWLVHTFWHDVPAGEDDPHFVLFINFILSDLEEGGFLGFFKKNDRVKIKQEIENLMTSDCHHPMQMLPDPPKITKADVLEWAQNNELFDVMPGVINGMIQKAFKNNNELYMQDIIGHLEEVMDVYESSK